MVPPTFLDGQPAVTEASRAMLVDVIVDISMAYKMHDETVHLATTYLDMHLACAPVRRDDLHLLGVGCLLVASKFEEVHPPEIDDLVDRFSSDTNFWDRDDLLAMEQRVLHALGFTLSFATPAAFLRRFVGAPCSAAPTRAAPRRLPLRALAPRRLVRRLRAVAAARRRHRAPRARRPGAGCGRDRARWRSATRCTAGRARRRARERCSRGEDEAATRQPRRRRRTRACAQSTRPLGAPRRRDADRPPPAAPL